MKLSEECGRRYRGRRSLLYPTDAKPSWRHDSVRRLPYGGNGGNRAESHLCLDFETGDVLWDERRGEPRAERLDRSTPTAACITARKKDRCCCSSPARSSSSSGAGSNSPIAVSRPPAHPVVANGRLYILRSGCAVFGTHVAERGQVLVVELLTVDMPDSDRYNLTFLDTQGDQER